MIKKYIKDNGLFKGSLIIFSKSVYKIFFPIFFVIYKKKTYIHNDRIVFTSVPDYSDNSRALYDYMIEKQYQNKYHFIWLVSDKSHPKIKELGKKPNTSVIELNGKWHELIKFRSLYYAMTARYVFYTHGSPIRLQERNDKQLVVNLWHGCGYKQKEETKIKKKKSAHADFYIVPGELFIEPKSKYWNCESEKILDIGYPRYDLFKSKNDKVEAYITNIKEEKETKVIFWMPTFRKAKNVDRYPEGKMAHGLDLPLLYSTEDVEELDNYCYKLKVKIVIKRHPLQVKYTSETKNYKNIIFIDDKQLNEMDIQLYEILSYTDALITDYSSIAIDYLLIDKPISFILDDFEKYKKIRGFVFNNTLDFMPGHHVYDKSQLLKFINTVSQGKDPYSKNREMVREIAHSEIEGYSKRILDTFNIY